VTPRTPALLQLLWLASPALPVGGFSYSEGLESAVESGRITDEHSATRWIVDQLRLGQARADLAVIASAMPAWRDADAARITELNAWVLTTREGAEMRQQVEQMGRSLADWLRQRAADDPRLPLLASLRPAPSWPVVMALALQRSGASTHDALSAAAFGWAENMVQAAVKSVPLGQSAGQRMLQALVDAIPAVVDTARATGDTERQAFTPMLAILSAQHETQYSRLFRS
jgi:urease accessory protein